MLALFVLHFYTYLNPQFPYNAHVCSSLSQVETRGCVLFTLDVARLLGLQDCGMASSSDQLLLRILTPILKLYTAKQAVAIASEGLESFGGQGYIEDTGLPNLLRDSQVYTPGHNDVFLRDMAGHRCCQYGREQPTSSVWTCSVSYRRLE